MSTEPLLRLGALAVACLLLAGCSQPSGGGPFDSPGGRLYVRHCASCHGAQGQGGAGPALNGAGAASQHSDKELLRIVGQGQQRPGQPEMPPFGGRLNLQDQQQVIAFIKTLWTDEQRSAQQARNSQ